MGKKTIPLLISAMCLALLGIIFIQYRWIKQSFDEKKKLIDHKVYEMVDNLDQRMTDLNAFAFISTSPELDSTIERSLFSAQNFAQYDTSFSGDSLFVSYISKRTDTAINQEMEVRFIGENNFHPRDDNQIFAIKDSLNIITSQIHESSVEIEDVQSILKRMRIEIDRIGDNVRLDSLLLKDELVVESNALGLLFPEDWGVYDNLKNGYTVTPHAEHNWDYELPLFKDDLIYPDRYQIRLNMGNNNAFIWKEITLMVILSLVFIGIIGFVFVYAIRLVIKHKKISAIKSDFINNMTHEFKTPLASISLAADSIIHPKIMGDPTKVKEYIGIIKSEKTKLNKHIETILEVASLSKDDIDIAMDKIELNPCIETAINKLGLLIHDRHCKITCNLAKNVQIEGNAYQLENVFSNLIENSIKYSEGPPVIHIHSEKQAENVSIKITDEGIGMTKEQMKRAFDDFYRAQKGNIHNTKGFGLGLSFVKFMVEKMNGQIRMESELNKGTSVIIEFPLWH